MKNNAVVGTATYKYSEVLNQIGFTKFDKQSLVQYAKGTQMTSLYISVFVTVFIYAFIMYFLNTFVCLCVVFLDILQVCLLKLKCAMLEYLICQYML